MLQKEKMLIAAESVIGPESTGSKMVNLCGLLTVQNEGSQMKLR